jgi:hypothetical protein
MNSELKIIRKVLTSQTFKKDGYEYDFMSIEPDDEGWALNIVVNVILPKKGQSYAVPVFSYNIHEILVNIWKYIGSSFSYSEQILVDGKEPVDRGLFVSTEKQRQVLSAMRNEIKQVTIWTAIGNLTFDVYWKPHQNFYYLDDVNIDFNFNIEIRNFILDGNPVVPNLEIADDVSGAILNVMYDSDSLRDDINNVIYDVMGDEININDVDDLYYQGIFFITKIDGFEVSGRNWDTPLDLEDGMFK